jgi:hypothetical protein
MMMLAKSVPVAGIDSFIARNISFKLRHDQNLSSVSTLTIQLFQKSVDLINYEMLRIFREIEYWRGLSESTLLKKYLTNIFYQGPIHFLSTIRRYFFDTSNISGGSSGSGTTHLLLQNEEMINLRLVILQNKFNSLAILLNNLHQYGSTLRSILHCYEQYWCHEHVIRGYSPETDESYSLDELTTDQYFQFTKESQKKIESCLEFLIHTFGNDTFVTRSNHHSNGPAATTDDDMPGEHQLSLNELYELAEKCVREAEVWSPSPSISFHE